MYKKTSLNNNTVKIETTVTNWRTGAVTPYVYITEAGSEGVAIPARQTTLVLDPAKIAAAQAEAKYVRSLVRPTSIIDMNKVAQVQADTRYIRNRLSGK